MINWVVPEQVSGLAIWPLVVVLALLVFLNIVNNRVAPQTQYLLWAFGCAVVLIAIGLLDGCSWTDMGLGRLYLLSGVFWGGLCIVLIALVYFIGSLMRRTRTAFHDERMSGLSASGVLFQALVEVPLGTVLLEEIAFRSVLFAMLARRFGLIWAIVLSCIAFGLWHVLPSIGTHEQNPALGSVVGEGRRGNVLAVLFSVVGTALSAVVFIFLRLLSGSVLAPMGLHWGTNGLGYAFSWVLIRLRDRGASRLPPAA
ncbi:MAG: CPBP family intramembrane metalloprotease [Actinomycetota bacterium]|nr:CPBP family intramembrane metalloprotease [Actinomycetota bacterium]